MRARIVRRPAEDQFARVDLVKQTIGETPLRGDHRLWILGERLTVDIDGIVETVPVGFTTDGASIPRVAQWLTGWGPWEEPHRWAAILHDWLYCLNGSEDAGGKRCGKPYADRAFRAVLEEVGCGRFRRTAMYWAVVLGGGPAYRVDQDEGPSIWR